MSLVRKASYITLIIAVIAAAWWLSRPTPPTVPLHTVATGTVESTVANTRTGTIMACRRSHIAPIVSGRVDQLLIKEGDQVEKGSLLLALWNDDLVAQVSLARSEANAAEAQAEETCVTADLAKRDAERIKQLQSKGLSSVESYDQAQNNAIAQDASCRAAKASIEVARSQLKVAKAALERMEIKAPFDGIVAEVNAELGEVLTPLSITGEASSGAVDLIEKGCLYISAPIDEIDAPAIQPGMHAYITLDAFPDQRFDGKVKRIAPYILDLEKQARTVEVEVEFVDAAVQQRMLPGYSTDVEIVLDSKPDTLWIPTSALLRDNHIWVYMTDGAIEKRKLEIGLSNWQQSEINKGLVAGERIVLPGDAELENGMQVIPKS